MEFAGEMAELGRLGEDLGRLGQEIGEEISSAFREAGWAGAKWTDSMTNKINEQMRRAQRKVEEQARKAEERARKAGEQGARVRVRFNEREWQLDPQRLEQIKAQASKAASEGISSAMEAVERAISNLHMPTPPSPPSSRPPTPPRPPAPPMPPMPRQSVRPDSSTGTQSSTPPTSGNPTSAPDLDSEREAILRMIAEGRISPEEGDLLLEGLGG
jgi:hypothetical protein